MGKGEALQSRNSRYSLRGAIAAVNAFTFKNWAAKNGRYVFYGTSILAYNVWKIFPIEFQKGVFFTLIALCFVFAAIAFLCSHGNIGDRIFVALAVNNLIEELGFGDPTKFTVNEYITTVIVVLIVISNYTKPSNDVAE